ncbi:MAG: class I SAM-dependent methyltransferase [Firmicutes bacterium]|nr:class I SAM-dependent methyltransferase [Bacillota bacterium]
MLRFGPTFFTYLLRQRFGPQRLRRQPEMDMVMLDEEQDREFALDGEFGALAVVYEMVIYAVLRAGPHSGKALDIASGSGQLLSKLALSLPEMRFTGTDLSDHMLHVARASARTYGASNVEFIKQDMFALETLAPQQFDLITWSLAMHHCQRQRDVIRVLEGAHRLLKPGGTFFLWDIIRPKTGPTAVAFADMYNRGRGSWFYQDSLDSYKAAFTFQELDSLLAQSPFAGARHIQPTLGNFFQIVCASQSWGSQRPFRSFLKTPTQRLDYWMLRLGFAREW